MWTELAAFQQAIEDGAEILETDRSVESQVCSGLVIESERSAIRDRTVDRQVQDGILLVPIGPLPAGLLTWLAGRLYEALGQMVVVGDALALPAVGPDRRRRQYQGDALLAMLQAHAVPGAGGVLGLIDADCYAPGLNFVFGQASQDRRVCFVALPRLRESFYNRPEDPELFRRRVLKEAVHELGHIWGLGHCPDVRCVMRFSNSLFDTDVKRAGFCPRCHSWLETGTALA